MNELIKTKLATPPRNNFTISRIRLIQRLNDGLRRKLILVSAPAGWGKTTLVSQWVRDSGIPTGWLSLDPPDNDPSRFISYFLAALANSSEHFGNLVSDSAPPSNLAIYASGHTMRAAFAAVINEATTLPDDTLLVLDDYHVINNPAIQEHLRFLLDHLPPKLHLALLNRSDSPLKLAQLRGRRQVLELRTAELSFTNDETVAYFAKAADKSLSRTTIDALHVRTEGWAVGLQLAVQSLADRTNIEGFLKDFTGSHRFVLDYLVEEVLANQTSETREFMLYTSILDRLSGPLCDAVTEQAGSQKRLANLEQRNMLLLSLDDTRTWFRYHHLFSDLLRHRLEQQHGDLVPKLHHRASDWFEQNGWINDAIHHALRAADYPHAASLITSHALHVLRKGQQFTLLRWIESIPQKVRAGQPHLCLWHAWALLFVGRVMDHASPLQLAEDAWTSAGDRHGLGLVMTFKANLARLQRNPLSAIDLAQKALDLLPDEDHEQASICTMSLGDAYTQIGQVNEALLLLDDLLGAEPPGRNSLVSLIAKNRRADVYMLQGQLQRAMDEFRSVLDAIGQNPIWQRVEALTGLSKINQELNNLAEAEDYLDQALELARQTEREIYLPDIYHTLAQLRVAQGSSELALDAIHHALDFARRFYHEDMIRLIKATRVRIALQQGDILTAAQWEKEIHTAPDQNPLLRESETLVAARIRLAQDDPYAALDRLRITAATAKSSGRFAIFIEANLLIALAHQLSGESDDALLALGQSLRLAEVSGYVRMYLNEGSRMAALLRDAKKASLLPAYVDQLLTSFAQPTSMPLVEQLTDRELEVLRLMAHGASNKQIANELVIALTTAKKHVSNIIGKLNAGNRTEAVASARDLGIL